MRLLTTLLLGCVLAVTAACGDAASKGDCEKLLEHLIDIETKEGGSGGDLSEDMKAALTKQKAAVKEYASGQRFIETCSQKTPKKVVSCGLSATDKAELAKCDGAK
jgi:hypothetical protein